MYTLGEKIRLARKSKGLSQDELAIKLGVNRVAISNYEKGKNNPTHANLLKLSAILNAQLLEETSPITRVIPFIGLASLGVPKGLNMGKYKKIPIDDKLFRSDMYAVEAEGDSMSPKINDGNIVYCSPSDDVESGNIVHYQFNGKSGISKINISDKQDIISLIPLNSAYDIQIINEFDAQKLKMSKIVGVVDTNF